TSDRQHDPAVAPQTTIDAGVTHSGIVDSTIVHPSVVRTGIIASVVCVSAVDQSTTVRGLRRNAGTLDAHPSHRAIFTRRAAMTGVESSVVRRRADASDAVPCRRAVFVGSAGI